MGSCPSDVAHALDPMFLGGILIPFCSRTDYKCNCQTVVKTDSAAQLLSSSLALALASIEMQLQYIIIRVKSMQSKL